MIGNVTVAISETVAQVRIVWDTQAAIPPTLGAAIPHMKAEAGISAAAAQAAVGVVTAAAMVEGVAIEARASELFR